MVGFLTPAWPVFLQSQLGFIRNTDLQSLKGRKGEIKEGSLRHAGREDEAEACIMHTDMLLLDDEVTLPFKQA